MHWNCPLNLRFMQHLEDALNVSLCGHFLIVLVSMCFAAFSLVTVQYKNRCMLLHYKIVNYEMWRFDYARFASKFDLSFPGRQTYRHLCMCLCESLYINIKQNIAHFCIMTAYHYVIKWEGQHWRMWLVRKCHIFTHYLIKQHFKKKKSYSK